MEQALDNRMILVAVDESEESMYALSWCLHNLLAQNTTNTLVLLYVKPPPPVYFSVDATEYLFGADVIATLEKHGKDLANSVMRRAEAIYQNFDTKVNTSSPLSLCMSLQLVTLGITAAYNRKESRVWRCKGCHMHCSGATQGRYIGNGKPRLWFLQKGSSRKRERTLCQTREVSSGGCEAP